MNVLKCLFVDSMPGFRALAEAHVELNNWPLEVHFENNPIDALKYLQRMAKEDFPDLIVAEIRLPFFSGLELAYRFKRTFGERFPHTRFYICSCPDTDLTHFDWTSNSYIDGLIHKPLNESCFQQLMKSERQRAVAS